MTRDQIVAMARQAGFSYPAIEDKTDYFKLDAFATCEKAAKQISDPLVLGDEVHAAGVNVCMNLARVIRALGERT